MTLTDYACVNYTN